MARVAEADVEFKRRIVRLVHDAEGKKIGVIEYVARSVTFDTGEKTSLDPDAASETAKVKRKDQ